MAVALEAVAAPAPLDLTAVLLAPPDLVFIASMRTLAVPCSSISSRSAALFDTSITLSCTNGPRSLIRKTRDLLFSKLVTRTVVPRGSNLCAAVMAF